VIQKSELGKIEYRLPTVPESLELWARMGVDPADLSNPKASIHNSFMLMSKVIANMGYLVSKVEYTIGDKAIKDYESLCKEMSAMADLCAVARRIVEAMNGGSEAKKKS